MKVYIARQVILNESQSILNLQTADSDNRLATVVTEIVSFTRMRAS